VRGEALSFQESGVCVVPSGLPRSVIDALVAKADKAVSGNAGARRFELEPPIPDLIAADGALGEIASRLMACDMKAVRALFFDKTPASNWAVPWHQDRTIAVQARAECSGYGPWTVKQGVVHVEPPEELLRGTVALRLHLDDCPAENGALEVLPGSWKRGKMSAAAVADLSRKSEPVVCEARLGDVVAMRGLTIHASKRAAAAAHRRVLHVDFAGASLPAPLEWSM
jgi:ectoine hydroxylase-related dioxygenase (phytanoyl-CoA dioxygenase family)